MQPNIHWGPITLSGIGQKESFCCDGAISQVGSTIFAAVRLTLYSTRHRIMTTVFATALAEGLALQEKLEEALRTIDGAIFQVGDHGESFRYARDAPRQGQHSGTFGGRCGG